VRPLADPAAPTTRFAAVDPDPTVPLPVRPAALREQIRRDRIGGTPAKELKAPPSIGIALNRSGGTWSCASCDEVLAENDGNWRDGAIVTETPIAERYATLEMIVRDRQEGPRVTVREHFCPGCAASLGVDVATDELERLPAAQPLGVAAAV